MATAFLEGLHLKIRRSLTKLQAPSVSSPVDRALYLKCGVVVSGESANAKESGIFRIMSVLDASSHSRFEADRLQHCGTLSEKRFGA